MLAARARLPVAAASRAAHARGLRGVNGDAVENQRSHADVDEAGIDKQPADRARAEEPDVGRVLDVAIGSRKARKLAEPLPRDQNQLTAGPDEIVTRAGEPSRVGDVLDDMDGEHEVERILQRYVLERGRMQRRACADHRVDGHLQRAGVGPDTIAPPSRNRRRSAPAPKPISNTLALRGGNRLVSRR